MERTGLIITLVGLLVAWAGAMFYLTGTGTVPVVLAGTGLAAACFGRAATVIARRRVRS